MKRPGGYSLVELLVALVLLQVGILGAVGTCVLAARLTTRAELLEWGTSEAQRVLDSLASVPPGPGEGEVRSGPGALRWSVGAGGDVRVEFLVADTVQVMVEGRLWAPAASDG